MYLVSCLLSLINLREYGEAFKNREGELTMETKAIQKYEEQGTDLLTHAESICIVDSITRELAVEFTNNARKAIKAIEVEFRPDIEKAHALHKDLLARLHKLTDPFKKARHVVDGEISRDYMEQERIRRELEREAQLEADAERKRQEEVLAKQAEEAIKEGDMETAEVLLDSEVVTAPIVPVMEVDKTVRSEAGSATMRKDVKVELVDKGVVITAVFDGKLPDTLLTVDFGVAKRYAKAGGLKSMPGFRITETATVSGRVG